LAHLFPTDVSPGQYVVFKRMSYTYMAAWCQARLFDQDSFLIYNRVWNWSDSSSTKVDIYN